MNIIDIPIINVAICIVITWALFAIVCSIINESVVQIKAERGRFMKKYLLQQLQDFPNGVNWGLMLYNHGTIDLLSRASEKPTNDIQPRLFAETLLDVVGKSSIVQISSASVADKLSFTHPSLNNFQAATLVLKPSDVVSFYKQALNSAVLSAPRVNGVIDEAAVYKNLIQSIENWYNELQERISLWYKKQTRQRLFLLGLLLAIILNVDSIQLFGVYQKNPRTTEAVISFYKQNQQNLLNLANKIDTSTANADTAGGSRVSTLNKVSAIITKKYCDSMNTDYLMKIDSLSQSLELPIGYKYSVFSGSKQAVLNANTGYGKWKYRLFKLLGYLITGFAASFGAPFWFDLLKNVISKKV